MPKIDKIVSVTSQITGGGVLRREFGIMLFLTRDKSVLGTGSNRITVVANADDAAVFASGTEPRSAMDILYQQVPYPKNCVIGRWITEDVPAELLGVEPASYATIKAITDGSFVCKGEDFTGIDFFTDVGVTDYATVASTIQTKLRTGVDPALAAATCVYNVTESRFEVTSGAWVGDVATLSVFSATDPLAGTDLSILLGLDANASLNQGADEETITEAIEAIVALNDSPFFISLENTIIDEPTLSEVRTWVQARSYMFFMDNLEAVSIEPGEETSVLSTFFDFQPDKVVAMWSNEGDYKALSFAGRYSSVNFSGSNTLITGNLKELPGTLSDDLSTTAQAELERKYCNYYAPFFSTGSPPANGVFNGTTMKPSVWADVQFFMQWAVNAVRVDVFNLLRNSNKVPQTEAGMAAIQGVIEAVMRQGIRNGGIAPGQLSAASTLDVQLTTGNSDFDGFLTTGFLVFAPGIFTQSQSDRNERKSPPWKVWMKGSGAIHEVEIALIFEN